MQRYHISKEALEELLDILRSPRMNLAHVPSSYYELSKRLNSIPHPAMDSVVVQGVTQPASFVDQLTVISRYLSNPIAVQHSHFVPRLCTIFANFRMCIIQ
jgi:hypothetical protein